MGRSPAGNRLSIDGNGPARSQGCPPKLQRIGARQGGEGSSGGGCSLFRPPGSVDQRYDAGLDRFGQRRPSFNNGREPGINWPALCVECAGFCAALFLVLNISRRFRPLFDSPWG